MEYKNEAGRIAVFDDAGRDVGEITFFETDGDTWQADHTLVKSAYRGRGIAGELVKRLVHRAKTEGKKIIPLCPFVKAEFDRVPAYREASR